MITAGSEPVATGIYCRMSLAVMNDPTKVEDQARIGQDLLERRGWRLAPGCGHPNGDGVYTDNSKSAWQKRRKRPAWDQMLADVDAGKLGAIIVYHGDRLVRQPFDLEKLISLADGKGIHLASPTGMRDLDNTDDRFVLRILCAQACMESDNTSRRRKAQYERWRREGRVRPGGRGGRSYCFETDGITQVAAECALIDGAADMILAGWPTGAAVSWLTSQGARTTTGIEFSHGTLRKLLARPRYAGLMPDGEHKAAWEPVLDMEKWLALRSVLQARQAGFGYATNARKYLLSGIALCDECSTGLQIRAEQYRSQLSGYGCRKPGCRKVQRQVIALDAYVIRRVVNRLARRDNPDARRMPTGALDAEFRALAGQRAETEAAITDPAQGTRLPLLLARLDAVDARLAELRGLAGGGARSQLLGRYAGISEQEFRDLPLGVQRSLVSAAFEIRVKRASKRGPGFNPDDVVMTPR